MRSSSGLYFARLDHVRAMAALMVYCWHFMHWRANPAYVPTFPPLSLLEEGHIGVGLFMTLSGYLFAKISDGRPISLGSFFANRFLRLAPLLAIVMIFWGWYGTLTRDAFINGFIFPTWTGGAWSIAVEMHFYAIFPLIIMLQARNRIVPLIAFIVAAIILRAVVWSTYGEVQIFAYRTIGGAIDLFLAGMLYHELAKRVDVRRHAGALLAGAIVALIIGVHAFNMAGGYYAMGGVPSPSPVWIGWTTFEGLAFGALIVGYEHLQFTMPPILDRVLAKIGEVSYSIYLLHFIIFRPIAQAFATAGFDMTNNMTALIAALVAFPIIVAVSIVSYHVIERPFLNLRRRYGSNSEARTKPARQALEEV